MLNRFLRTFFAVIACLFSTTAIAQQPFCSPNCSACPSCNFCGSNCTLTQGFWKNHTECWPANFNPETTKLCGLLWLDILNEPVKGRPWFNLAHQWIAAMLNQANGARIDCMNCSECFEGCNNPLVAGESLLTTNCANMNDKTPDAAFTCLAMLLDDYNNGNIAECPKHCGGETPCQGCDCGICCPQDCNTCVDCPNLCELAVEAGCSTCCPCPDCVCEVACPQCVCVTNPPPLCSSSSSSSSSCSHHHHKKKHQPKKSHHKKHRTKRS